MPGNVRFSRSFRLIQRGTISIAPSETEADVTIEAVDPSRCEISMPGLNTGEGYGSSGTFRLVLLNTVTIRAVRLQNDGGAVNHIIPFQVKDNL